MPKEEPSARQYSQRESQGAESAREGPVKQESTTLASAFPGCLVSHLSRTPTRQRELWRISAAASLVSPARSGRSRPKASMCDDSTSDPALAPEVSGSRPLACWAPDHVPPSVSA